MWVQRPVWVCRYISVISGTTVGTSVSSDIDLRSLGGQGIRKHQQREMCVGKKSRDVFHELNDIIEIGLRTGAVHDRSTMTSFDPGVVPGGDAKESDQLSSPANVMTEATNLVSEALAERDDKSNEYLVICDDECSTPESTP